MDDMGISKHMEVNKAVFKDESKYSLLDRKRRKQLRVSQNEADYTPDQWSHLNKYDQNTFVRYLLHHCFKDNRNLNEGITTDRLPQHRQRGMLMNIDGFKNFEQERLEAIYNYDELRKNQKREAARLKKEELDKKKIIQKMVTGKDLNPLFIQCRNCKAYYYLNPPVDENQEDEFPRESEYYTCVDPQDHFLILHCRENNKNKFYCGKCLREETQKHHWYSQHKTGCKTCKTDSITIQDYLHEHRNWQAPRDDDDDEEEEEETSDSDSSSDDGSDSGSDDDCDSMVTDNSV